MKKYLVALLWITCFHSALVGITSIAAPEWLYILLGFSNPIRNFFPVQGGVFHIIMAIAYGLAAYKLSKYKSLVVFTIIVKLMAAVFLFLYYFTAEGIWSVLLSGIIDGIIGLTLLTTLFFYELDELLLDLNFDLEISEIL